ncbi:hypothetical protein BH09BAC1_BH09BAC1_24850 [soil metagenome]
MIPVFSLVWLIGIIIANEIPKNTTMKNLTWLLCVLCLLFAGQVMAQKKSEKKQRKELAAIATAACTEHINTSPEYATLRGGLATDGYCSCMMDNLFSTYTIEQLTEMFTNKSKTEVALSFFADEGNYGKTLNCMRSNVKNDAVLKAFVLGNSFGLETCVASIEEQGLDVQINAEGYCKCMFTKMESDFSLDEILSEKTYDGDKFKVLAMECVVANTK